MEVMNSSLVSTHPLLVEKIKPGSNLLKGKEVPYFFLHIFVMVVFLIICFLLPTLIYSGVLLQGLYLILGEAYIDVRRNVQS